jgi:outer membrane protein OmpA-like peptidoglycan-associated protein
MKTILNIRILPVLIIMLMFSTINSYSQTKLEKGKSLMSSFDYSKALLMFNDYFVTAQPTIENARDMVECYTNTSDVKNAALWQKKVVAFDQHTADDVLLYAKLLMSLGEYDLAIEQFNNYSSMQPTGSEKASEWISACNNAIAWIQDPAYVTVTNVSSVNSKYSEFGLIQFNDEYIVTSDRKISGQSYSAEDLTGWTGDPYYKLSYVKKSDKGDFSSSLSTIDGLNNNYHNGPAVYNYDTKTIYFTRTKMVKVSKHPVNSDPTSWYDHSTAGEWVNRLEIYSSKYANGKWTTPTSFQYNKPDEYSIGHPTLSPDGETIYFVSDMPGGYGSSDIYYCDLKDDGSWSAPQNAGSTINTEGKEVFPFVDDNGTLYYSSDGLAGMGGLDIFSATGSKNSWSEPVNLKYPINSSKDDFSINFTKSGEEGYFASNRDGGAGSDDIYSFTPEIRSVVLVGTTNERLADDKLALLKGVSIALNNTTSGNKIILTSDENGKFISTLDCGASYEVNGSLEGYIDDSKDFSTLCKSRSDTVFVDLDLDKKMIYLVGITKEKLKDNSLASLSGVRIMLDNASTGATVSMISDENGKFTSYLDCGMDYTVSGTLEGYFAQSADFATVCKTRSDTVYVELDLDKIVVNKPIVLKNIYYDFDKWNIRSDAAIELDKLVKILVDNPTIKVELGSHTDCRGTNEYNEVLSQKRAESAVEYIISKGISSDRITAKGYGESIPVNKCVDGVSCTEDEYQMDRRTEFKVTGFITQ